MIQGRKVFIPTPDPNLQSAFDQHLENSRIEQKIKKSMNINDFAAGLKAVVLVMEHQNPTARRLLKDVAQNVVGLRNVPAELAKVMMAAQYRPAENPAWASLCEGYGFDKETGRDLLVSTYRGKTGYLARIVDEMMTVYDNDTRGVFQGSYWVFQGLTGQVETARPAENEADEAAAAAAAITKAAIASAINAEKGGNPEGTSPSA